LNTVTDALSNLNKAMQDSRVTGAFKSNDKNFKDDAMHLILSSTGPVKGEEAITQQQIRHKLADAIGQIYNLKPDEVKKLQDASTKDKFNSEFSSIMKGKNTEDFKQVTDIVSQIGAGSEIPETTKIVTKPKDIKATVVPDSTKVKIDVTGDIDKTEHHSTNKTDTEIDLSNLKLNFNKSGEIMNDEGNKNKIIEAIKKSLEQKVKDTNTLKIDNIADTIIKTYKNPTPPAVGRQ
ncbi:hypothetical protein KAZ01_01315, partial [Candidatus Gracilibacteria bacterium]|nr:hypothetical protein [Candidatus Gracilibacteria bacterium]